MRLVVITISTPNLRNQTMCLLATVSYHSRYCGLLSPIITPSLHYIQKPATNIPFDVSINHTSL